MGVVLIVVGVFVLIFNPFLGLLFIGVGLLAKIVSSNNSLKEELKEQRLEKEKKENEQSNSQNEIIEEEEKEEEQPTTKDVNKEYFIAKKTKELMEEKGMSIKEAKEIAEMEFIIHINENQ